MPDVPASSPTAIDSHAHVFTRGLNLASERRYAPSYDALLGDYLGQLQRHGFSHGVLVQPSFLGTDNRYLLSALQTVPGQLRGVVMLEPDVERAALDEMARLGVRGVRLNLMGQALPDLRDRAWRPLLERIAEQGWHLELHRHVADIPALVRALEPYGLNIVVDHFGRPDARLGLGQPGFAELLTLGGKGKVWVKVSGVYRLEGTPEQNLTFARQALGALEAHYGAERLMWGSDWPHTQHEAAVSFATVVEQFEALGCSAELRRALLVDTARDLFGFE
ncbi:amidohydrolase family protein [Pseudomonas putida]|uniref:Amidohydrolase family protein n=1 Tax=Pseudomonas putida TaxID=303 RepID=A0A7W2L2V1_PSEPU|nr:MULTISPECIES: amidohydrolase family protein [Pseudomonas]MBA6117378.1 amidohydrolase family protein [Pseudomonas putida]MBI6943078.1 amidohydrolase family protein [Pseudomonas putida]MBI6959042.1 amidohydrolase family protein [Pseudomonas putida]MCZ9636385.1 amidohydrolase family protein [Pseudomonas putida]MEC4876049.1 amidohydrolase family protein [Pseudomonas sp. NC26]